MEADLTELMAFLQKELNSSDLFVIIQNPAAKKENELLVCWKATGRVFATVFIDKAWECLESMKNQGGK